MAKRKTEVTSELPLFYYLRQFYVDHKKIIRQDYKDLTKKILAQANPANAHGYLRTPQYEAFEIYIFLKEYLNNPKLGDLFENWCANKGKFKLEDTRISSNKQGDLFPFADSKALEPAIKQLKKLQQDYANYIFSLTMGTGKTVLMALCIFYEFLLADKYPDNPLYCHNALVLAPDTTVLQSLKEIQTFDKSKVFSKDYENKLNGLIKYHFLEDDGIPLSTTDGSNFNIIISTSQKIILRKKHTPDDASSLLFKDSWSESLKDNPLADLYALDNEGELMANQRYTKLTRLPSLGIYVDEAHHAFGKTLKSDMMDRSKETSLRLTIDNLAAELSSAESQVVACYNFTGTPYVDNQLMPEVVYNYGLRQAIENKYLKEVDVIDFENYHSEAFIEQAIHQFCEAHRDATTGEFRRYEGMLPKMALFASTIDELQKELRPAVENALLKEGLALDTILINVGDDKITKADDLKAFRLLDKPESNKQFILLVGKGKEGWNCRSLFSVALFRKPKSTIFVLQATMRCLRAITDTQQLGKVFLSTENLEVLQQELKDNFRMTVEDLTKKSSTPKRVRRIYIRERIPVKVIEQVSRYETQALQPQAFTIFDNDFNADKYKVTTAEHKLSNLDASAERREIRTAQKRTFTHYSLIAELSLYLTQHAVDGENSVIRYSPIQIERLLKLATDGDQLLDKVNDNNDILYDFVIPKLFSQLYKVEYVPGEPVEVTKFIVKEPPNSDDSGPYFEFQFDDEHFVSEDDKGYSQFNQSGNKKSFDLSGYGFDSNPERIFFDENLFKNDEIKHIWFTGMLTHGQSEFYVHYIDPENYALRTYYPDFLIEMKDGDFWIVEIKGENLLEENSTQAKIEYATHLFQMQNRMFYKVIPSKQARYLLTHQAIQAELEQNRSLFNEFIEE